MDMPLAGAGEDKEAEAAEGAKVAEGTECCSGRPVDGQDDGAERGMTVLPREDVK
ncbi:hypothetical protein GCM10010324_61460 [Streptomyces hiroshimensis]|uniref:Uncharacterized protein n=1 Tax=Streptomyces hiroshimensis TaxID=66424 RepID=A0ABQ2ZAC3_9ACTN|nr:hypothetical protein GCM10010324_61460 [Streptomyces hiroshimensis]